VRHGETFSMSDYYSQYATPEQAAQMAPPANPSQVLKDGTRVLYRPTCHYAYCPCDGAWNSLLELQMRYVSNTTCNRATPDRIFRLVTIPLNPIREFSPTRSSQEATNLG